MITLLLSLLALLIVMDLILNRYFRFKRPWYLSPILWLSAPWILSLLLLALPIFIHRESLEHEHVMFIFICHLAFAIGCWLHSFASKKVVGSDNASLGESSLIAFAALGLIGHFAGAMDSISSSGVSIIERLTADGLARARASVFLTQTGMYDSTAWSRLTPLIAFSYIFIACHVLTRDRASSKPRTYVRLAFWASIAAIAINSLLISAGRMHIILLGAIISIVFLIKLSRSEKIKNKTNWARSTIKFAGGACVVIAAVTAATLFGQARSADNQNADEYLFTSHRAELHPVASDLSNSNPTLRFGLFTLSYFTVPIPTLSFYLDTPDYRYPGPYWGQYNFPPIVGRIVKRVNDENYAPWPLLRADVFDLLAREGFATNVWSTLLRDLSVDVGIRGTPFAMFALGLLTSFLVSYSIRTLNPLISVTSAALLVVCGFSVLHSLLYIEYISGLIFIPLAAFVIMRIYSGFSFSRRSKS